ncbi:MAG: DUF1622 domain-containing protein [Spirochaetes bacterium]|uniref:DUF1622 domain-containing protein n=1 Tax=Candidatus Gallitreponema excrementavium TaxID=2840840 RepID=A0A9D9HQC8_9SPIR|nr:DUF1622 domain-containing protein [Candidatus Gallitreponema excrementavium]
MINNLSVVHILETLAFITGCVSMVVVLYGTLVSFLSFLKNEIRRISGKFSYQRIRVLRADLGTYLLFGLEILIASDVLKTIIEPSFMELGILAGIVVLRTVLSVFLNREINEIEKDRRERRDYPENFQ